VFDTRRALADALGRPIGLKIARLRAGARAWSHLSTSAALQVQSDLAIGTRELSRPPRRAVLAPWCWRINCVALSLTLWLRQCSMLGRLVGEIVATIRVDIFAVPSERFDSKERDSSGL
jgi:hypothetical protein